MEKETYRVKIYSLPSKNGNTKLKYFADVPTVVVGQVIATMLPHGKAVLQEQDTNPCTKPHNNGEDTCNECQVIKKGV